MQQVTRRGEITISYTAGKPNLADLLTKLVTRQHLERLRPLLGAPATPLSANAFLRVPSDGEGGTLIISGTLTFVDVFWENASEQHATSTHVSTSYTVVNLTFAAKLRI